MQYNKIAEGKFKPLKQKNVDTGMGVERTLAILNKNKSVYETTTFLPIIKNIIAIIAVPKPIIPYCPKPLEYAFPANPKNVNAENFVAASVKNKIIGPNVLFAIK